MAEGVVFMKNMECGRVEAASLKRSCSNGWSSVRLPRDDTCGAGLHLGLLSQGLSVMGMRFAKVKKSFSGGGGTMCVLAKSAQDGLRRASREHFL